jgi:branched-chain amino acid transport system ATP-binding protein
MRPAAVLSWSDVTADYGDGVAIIHDVSVSIGEREVVAVIGPNGAGKSTLLKSLLGEAMVSRGRIELEGRDVTRWPADRLARLGVGYVPQLRDVMDGLTVTENLEIGGYLLSKADRTRRIGEVMDLFPRLRALSRRPVKRLSGGERKLVGIGRALVRAPRVLLLDEPTASLAPAYASDVLAEAVTASREQGATIVLIEQRAAEALAVSDWCYVLHDGRNYLDLDAKSAREQLHTIGSALLGDALKVE